MNNMEIEIKNIITPFIFCVLQKDSKIEELYTDIATYCEDTNINAKHNKCIIEMRSQFIQEIQKEKRLTLDIVVRGEFIINNVDRNDMEKVMRINCCAMLYPYLRETISRISALSEYGKPYYLPSKNFVEMYNQWFKLNRKHNI